MDYTVRGTLNILRMGIYVNDNSMANMLSLKEVTDYILMNMNTK